MATSDESKWVVVKTDNYDRDYGPPDEIVSEPMSKVEAETEAERRNAKCDPHGEAFFKIEPEGFMPASKEP